MAQDRKKIFQKRNINSPLAIGLKGPKLTVDYDGQKATL
jgi:hypothetical protein